MSPVVFLLADFFWADKRRQQAVRRIESRDTVYASRLSREPMADWLLPEEPEVCDAPLAIPGVTVEPVEPVAVVPFGFEALLDRACCKRLMALLFPAPPP